MAESVLKATNLGISFGGLRAVHDFEIDLKEGELVGLIGPNGAGKTTVFNLFTGVYKPTEGAFYLGGKLMNGKKTHEIVAAGIALPLAVSAAVMRFAKLSAANALPRTPDSVIAT